MKKRMYRRPLSMLLAVSMTASMAMQGNALDTLPFPGDAAPGENQPSSHGYRPEDIRYWDPTTDLYAKFGRSQTPLQQRNEAFAATQANPDLSSKSEYFALAGDYGNSFFETFQSNNFFSNYVYNFWQYTDYYAAWHGQVTAEFPPELKNLDFGVLNLPNAAYTSAAHKNGTLSLGCLFLPRASQPASPLLVQAEDGTFPVADKLKEMCDYFGFDGYFINQEISISMAEVAAYQDFLAYCREIGIYMQWYDSINADNGMKTYYNEFVRNNSAFVYTEEKGNMADSIFLNYWWGKDKINRSVAHANELGVDPLHTVFFGIEGGMHHWSQPYSPQALVGEDGNLVASIAILGSDFVHSALGEDVKGLSDNPHMLPEYQWMTFERERLWFSGPEKDPSKAGINMGIDNTKVTGNVGNNWAGIANYITERSVIDGSVFHTNFNTGHGMQYFKDGTVSNDEEWTNMNVQDILPSWQWWMESDGTKLDVSFDYGEKYNKGDYYNYQSVGGYSGGSSLVVNGKLDAENFLRLYKTDLQVKGTTKASVTFNKVSATDSSSMELGVIFKNDPGTVVTFHVPNANQQTDGWVTKEISLGDYAGEEIAAMGLVFKNGETAVDNYQMNIGELKITDKADYTPETPTGFALETVFDTTEMYVKWDLADYDEVKQYNLYAQLSDGTTRYVGGAYDDVYYIKSLYKEKDIVKLLLTAEGEDGSESQPAELSFDFKKNVSNIEYTAYPGYIDLTWDSPVNDDYDSIAIVISLNNTDRTDTFTAEVEKGATSARVMVPVNDGLHFDAAISTVKDGVKGNPIVQSGKTKDCYSKPYDGLVSVVSSTHLALSCPTSSDWKNIYVYENGREITRIPKGSGNMNDVGVKDANNRISVVLEDFSGNLSKEVPVGYVPYAYQAGDLTSALIPDDALREAIHTQVGTTVQEAMAFTGTLDLSGTDLSNLEGISLLRFMSGLNLSDCTKLENILPSTFVGNGSLSEINLTGCSGLKILSLSNTNLEKIVCDDPSALRSLVSVDLSGSRFDFSEGTPEKTFADAIAEITKDAEDIVVPESELSDLAPLGTVVEDQTNVANAYQIFNGKLNNLIEFGEGSTAAIDFGSQQTIHSLFLRNYSNRFGLEEFELLYSNDNVTYESAAKIVGNTAQEVSYDLAQPVTGRYFKLVGQKAYGRGGYINGMQLLGYDNITYPAGVKTNNQRPAGYPDLNTFYLDVNRNGKPINMKEYYAENIQNMVTVRGTSMKNVLESDFVAEGYSPVKVSKELHLVRVTDADGNIAMDTIPTNKPGMYTVEYITYNDANNNGEVMFTQTVYVRAVTSVLEAVIANAEQMIADNALENTMEAVVTEFYAALDAAREMVNKDGATQEEINAATVRLLSVMAKVDWKQGDKTILEIAIQVAETIEPNLDKYVDSCVGPFTEALANARALMESGNAWDDDIQAATTALVEAMSNMKMKPNKDALNELIASAKTMDLSGYTADSADALRSALAAAEAMAENQAATQDQVDAAANTLKAALDGLTVKNGGNGNAPSDDNNGTTAPVGDGSAPTKTGDSMNAAGLAALALLSAAAVVTLKKRKIR